MRGRIRWISALLIAALPAVAMLTANDKASAIDALLEAYSKAGAFNGSALVAEHGKVIFKKGYGLADFEWNVPNTPDTKFRLGSITKQFTATLVMQLVEEGKLSVDARLADLLPYYRKDTGSKITIHHLLTHTSGIPSYTSQPNFMKEVSRDPYGVREFVEKFCSGELEFEPGTRFRYNNSGYFILGAIVEQIGGASYQELLKKRIFDPLAMSASGYDRSAALLEKRARGYEAGAGKVRNAEYLDMSLPYAAGSLYSTVEDLYVWDQALYGEKVLPAKALERMLTPALDQYRLRLDDPQGARRSRQGRTADDCTRWRHQRVQHVDRANPRGSTARRPAQQHRRHEPPRNVRGNHGHPLRTLTGAAQARRGQAPVPHHREVWRGRRRGRVPSAREESPCRSGHGRRPAQSPGVRAVT